MISKKFLKIYPKLARYYRGKPNEFIQDIIFNGENGLDEQMSDFVGIYNQADMIALKSGTGTGKTATIAMLCLYQLFCFPMTLIPYTGPTKGQLNDSLTKELKKWYRKSKIFETGIFDYNGTGFFINCHLRDEWKAMAKNVEDTVAMQGIHSERLLFIVEEASHLTEDVYKAIIGAMSQGKAKIIMAGNPDKLTGVFYNIFHSKTNYHLITLSALKSKNIDKKFIETIKDQFGEDSDTYKIKILGDFPDREQQSYISDKQYTACYQPTEKIRRDKISIGFDPSRGGDESCAAIFDGNIQVEIITYLIPDVIKLAGQLQNKINDLFRYETMFVNIDATGLGVGVYDFLKREKDIGNIPEQVEIHLTVYSEKVIDKNQYADKPTELIFNIYKMIESGEIQLLEDEQQKEEFTLRKYTYDKFKRYQIEDKETFKKTIKRSPNKADAVCLAMKKLYTVYAV